ncbi:RidA family protein [uncultured Ferrovibrio sp.]|jgi:enamine deaminase RidA (YjgF/YER057c/UK114 family)|uniref:RidA family protein n=1 Tax=uncultured Ferrovibrio sp. TaxID=1576913 RepID=UPI002616CCCA|nr:RidA family protein [uncultured Ferrovibrio sp.]
MAERRLISSGSRFEATMGYSRAVVDGEWIHVSGTTGYDYSTMTISEDVVEQTEQTFRNISAALAQAGASLDDVVRVHYYLTDANYFPLIAPVCGRHFAKARPAATALICQLIDPAMKLEIEVTARKRAWQRA